MADIDNIELLKRAKSYIDKLANGVNPITDEVASDDSCVNNIKISRCLFFVSDVLNQVIENGGRVGAPPKKSDLPLPTLTAEVQNDFCVFDYPVGISAFAKALSEVLNRYGMQKISAVAFTGWLASKKLLGEKIGEGNRKSKVVNEYSASVGIISEQRNFNGQEYTAVLYTPEAQKFLLDNLDEIVSYHYSKKTEVV